MKFESIVTPLPGGRDLVQIMAHRSCQFLTSLSISQWQSPYSPEALITNELLRTLTLVHHDDSVCTHLKSLTLYCRTSEALLPALLDMVESRIGSDTGQPPEGLLQELRLHINSDHEENLDEIVKRSTMEYENRARGTDRIYSVQLVRRGFRVPVQTVHLGDLV